MYLFPSAHAGTSRRRSRLLSLPWDTWLFSVPRDSVRMLERDLAQAGIPKRGGPLGYARV